MSHEMVHRTLIRLGEQNQVKITLSDVARQAGVSNATASMVFNNVGRVSDETRSKVLAIADTLGYVHRRRKAGSEIRGGTIALLFLVDPEWAFAFAFIRPIIATVEQELEREGFRLITVPISHHESVSRIISRIGNIGSAAVLTIHYASRKFVTQLETMGIPVIVLMNSEFQDEFYTVCVDDFQGAYEGTRYLIKLGHRSIGFIDQDRDDLPMLSTDRYLGFTKALEEIGLEANPDYRVRYEKEDVSSLQAHLSQVLSVKNPPSALFCLDDDLAWRVVYCLNELGVRVPQDLSIIASGDVVDYSLPMVPQITTMRIDTTYMGKIAVHMLLNRREENAEANRVLKIRQHLVVRESCSPYGGSNVGSKVS